MKAIFPLLLCYVLMTSQTFALSGGPTFGGNNGSVNPIGTFGGTLTPTDAGDPLSSTSALGLFTFNVPTTGLASGSFLLFSDGLTFNGTITASVDADNGTVLGVLDGNYRVLYQVSTGANGSITRYYQVLATASGRVNGKVRSSRANSVSSARLGGTALITVNTFDDFNVTQSISTTPYTFNGFRQSLTAASSTTGTATTSTGTGTTGAGL